MCDFCRTVPISRRKKWNYGFHAGVDFGLPEGTSIIAAGGGTITWIHTTCPGPGTGSGCGSCGNRVRINDGTFTFSYCHFKTVSSSLAVGDTVVAGQYLGELGKTGLTGGWPHLHFDMKYQAGIAPLSQGIYVNPFPFLDAWCRKLACR